MASVQIEFDQKSEAMVGLNVSQRMKSPVQKIQTELSDLTFKRFLVIERTMQGFARLQLVGPVVLFCAVLAAEAAAYALAQMPSSGFLWYLNLEVFSIFRRSRAALAELGNLPFAQVLLIAGPMVRSGSWDCGSGRTCALPSPAISASASRRFLPTTGMLGPAPPCSGRVLGFRPRSCRQHPLGFRHPGDHFLSLFRRVPLSLFRRAALQGMTGAASPLTSSWW